MESDGKDKQTELEQEVEKILETPEDDGRWKNLPKAYRYALQNENSEDSLN